MLKQWWRVLLQRMLTIRFHYCSGSSEEEDGSSTVISSIASDAESGDNSDESSDEDDRCDSRTQKGARSHFSMYYRLTHTWFLNTVRRAAFRLRMTNRVMRRQTKVPWNQELQDLVPVSWIEAQMIYFSAVPPDSSLNSFQIFFLAPRRRHNHFWRRRRIFWRRVDR